MGLRAKIGLLLLVQAASASVDGESPIPLEQNMRGIALEVQDDFAERPGTLIDIYVVTPPSTWTTAAVVMEKEVYTNKETVIEPSETILLSNVQMLFHIGPSRGLVVIGIDKAKAAEVEVLREKYRGKLRARVVK